MTCLLGSLLKRSRIGWRSRVRDLAVVLQRAERRQRLRQRLQRLDPLREDDRLAAALGHLVHVGDAAAPAWRSRRCSGSKLQICLSRITSSKTCCTRDRVAQFVEVDDALLLGQVVAVALGRRQFEVRRRGSTFGGMSVTTSSLMRRRMQSRVSSGSSFGRRVRRDAVRIDEGEDVDEVLDAVLDRRAGHRPAAVAVRCCAPPGPSSTRGS